MMKIRRGAVKGIPRALRCDWFVVGQILTGWDAARLGVPADIISQVDPVTLCALVPTAEAFDICWDNRSIRILEILVVEVWAGWLHY